MQHDELMWLQNWYLSYCDGDREHQYGISIDTLDNPGWRVRIDLRGTKLEKSDFEKLKIERTDSDWVHCWTDKKLNTRTFEAAGGPLNLGEIIGIFRKWYEGER
jgi:Immunity protein 53